MRIPEGYISTSVSRMISRQIPNICNLLRAKKLRIECFYDKLDVHFNNLDETFISKCCPIEISNNQSGYKKGWSCTWGNVGFILFQDCCHSSPWIYKLSIKNARRGIDRFSKIEKLLENLIKGNIRENHNIARIDIGFAFHDSQITAAILHYCSHLKWKSKERCYGGNDFVDLDSGYITGFHSRGSGVRVSSYNEKAKPKKMQRNNIEEVKTEFQVKKQHMKKKDIATIYDLRKIKDTNLLDRIRIYNPLWLSVNHRKSKMKFKDFQIEILALGFTQARKKLNPNGNFSRDYGKFLEPLKIKNGRITLEKLIKKRWLEWHDSWLCS